MDLLWKPIGDIVLQDQVNAKGWNKVGSMKQKKSAAKKAETENIPLPRRDWSVSYSSQFSLSSLENLNVYLISLTILWAPETNAAFYSLNHNRTQ